MRTALFIGGTGTNTYWFGGGDGNDSVVAATDNKYDTVTFGQINGVQIGGADLSSVALSGQDLVITLTSSDVLTIQSWDASAGNKLNTFNFGANGNYSVAFTDGVAVWTKIS